MNIKKIKVAKKEAQEFIRRVDVVLAEHELSGGLTLISGSRKTGALRRQSLELTNALADMRRPS